MKNFIQNGNAIDVVLAAAVVGGDVVVVGDMVGVAAKSGEVGDTIALSTNGVYELPKGNAAMTQGKRVYWDANAKQVVSAATGNVQLGYVFYAAAADASVVAVSVVPA